MTYKPVFAFLIIVGLTASLYHLIYYTRNQTKDPDAYSPEGYCIVNTAQQMVLGLSRFKNENEFLQKCNGKMIFEFGNHTCTTFTSNKMHFPVVLKDFNTTHYLDVNSSQYVCGKRVTEALVKVIIK